MPFIAILLLFILQVARASHGAEKTLYAVATEAAPVLNRPDFRAVFGGRDGNSPETDDCGQIRALEFVALPGTVFAITGEERIGDLTLYRVTTGDYPYPSVRGYFVDSRQVRPLAEKPAERVRGLPPREKILALMKKRLGSGYVWGGNVAEGVENRWGAGDRRLLAGLDCSGLLYEATGGYTPRNTGALVHFGRGVPIAGSGATAIAAGLRPLDLIVWPGHVLIVIDNGNVIESRLVCGNPSEGVRIRPLRAALAEIVKTRRPGDEINGGAREFVVRRWYGDGE